MRNQILIAFGAIVCIGAFALAALAQQESIPTTAFGNETAAAATQSGLVPPSAAQGAIASVSQNIGEPTPAPPQDVAPALAVAPSDKPVAEIASLPKQTIGASGVSIVVGNPQERTSSSTPAAAPVVQAEPVKSISPARPKSSLVISVAEPIETSKTALGEASLRMITPGEAAGAPAESPLVAATTSTPPGAEVIRVRYPNRRIRIERTVVQDEHHNYVNHGSWTMWDPDGQMLGKGQYQNGKIHGQWNRWFIEKSAEHFTGKFYEGFAHPFSEQATFVDGQLQGKWITRDAEGRAISEWEFDHDQLNGKVVWFYPSGKQSREENYVHGVLDGAITQWKPDGTVSSQDTFRQGRRLVEYIKTYPGGEKQISGYYLSPLELTQTSYDWWQGELQIEVLGVQGAKERTGVWTYWYANGGKNFEGEFVGDLATGRHSWWYQNGQTRLEGDFVEGKQQGEWTWWYENGQKYISGSYLAGNQVGSWMKWMPDGHVVAVQEDVSRPSTPEPATDTKVATSPSSASPLQLKHAKSEADNSHLEAQVEIPGLTNGGIKKDDDGIPVMEEPTSTASQPGAIRR